jgi:hypothetical protein
MIFLPLFVIQSAANRDLESFTDPFSARGVKNDIHMRDQLDAWCYSWARQRRKVLGLDKQFTSTECLGKLSCTLGRIKEEAEGASQGGMRIGLNGHPDQNWPEVYVGIPLEIHRCFMRMPGEWRTVMDAHYVWREVSIVDKIRFIGITPRRYADVLELLKTYLAGYLRVDTSVVERPRGRPKKFVNVTQIA